MDVDLTGATVGVASTDDTATVAGIITQRAFAGYMAPLGYSAVADEESPAESDDAHEPYEEAAETSDPFLLVGSALMTIFVVGVLALVASIVVTVRPMGDQRPGPAADAGVSSTQPNSAALETIANPVPVVQEAPRTVFVTPRVAAPAAPVVTLMPQASAPVPEAPAPVPVVAPVPVALAPVIPQLVPQLLPQLLPQLRPQIVAPPVRDIPVPRSPAVSTSTSSTSPAQTTPAQTTPPENTPVQTTPVQTTPVQTTPVQTTPVQTSAAPTTPPPLSTTAQASTTVESASATTGSGTSSPPSSSTVSTTPLLPTTPAA